MKLRSHSIASPLKFKSCRRSGEIEEVKGHVVPQSPRGKAAKVIENGIKLFHNVHESLLHSALELT